MKRKIKEKNWLKLRKNTRKDEKSMDFIRKFTKNKGITLIALVVTIILLLILAGVSISMLTGKNRNIK